MKNNELNKVNSSNIEVTIQKSNVTEVDKSQEIGLVVNKTKESAGVLSNNETSMEGVQDSVSI